MSHTRLFGAFSRKVTATSAAEPPSEFGQEGGDLGLTVGVEEHCFLGFC